MKIFIVVPNWNGAALIEPCLVSLENQSVKAGVIVVDNGSTDESNQIIEDKFPKVILIKLPENLGFAGGVNVGIDYALENGADAVALFNNDAVANKDWLEELTKPLENDHSIGITTCKLMRDDRKHFDSTGDFYSIRGIPFPRGRNQPDDGRYNTPEYVFGGSGGASLYKADMLKEVGRFDERFFAYYEDVDISFRAQLYGWKVYYNPNSVAYHHVSATSSKLGTFSHFHSNKNFYYLYIKNMPGRLFFKYLPSFIYQALRSCASSIINRRLTSYLKAMGQVAANLPGIIKDRREIQRKRKSKIQDIDELLHHSKPPISPNI